MKKVERNVFNYNHLYYFYITFNSDSLTEAATKLGIVRQVLKGQLKHLQKNIGVKLYEEIGLKKQLTPFGERVHAYCTEIFENETQLRNIILEGKNDKPIGPVTT